MKRVFERSLELSRYYNIGHAGGAFVGEKYHHCEQSLPRNQNKKAAGCDEILPEMIKAFNRNGVLWLTRMCQMASRSGRAPNDWELVEIITIHKKGDRRESTNDLGQCSSTFFVTVHP